MDLDVDVEVNFLENSDDKIHSFLSTKLEEVRSQNEVLENVLLDRREALQQVTDTQETLKIGNIWKKILYSKCIIGLEILSLKCFSNIRIVLNEFEESLNYKVHTFNLDQQSAKCIAGKNCQYVICGLLKRSETFENRAYAVIYFNLPQFLYRLEYDLCGYIICTLDGQDIDIPFPSIKLTVKDSLCQTSWLTDDNCLPNFLSIVSCTNMSDLVIRLPKEWRPPLVGTLEIHCSLTYLLVMKKPYFIANRISDLFDGTLVTFHPHEFMEDEERDIFLKVYTSTDKQLFAFLHHLLSCIPNSIIIPTSYYQSVLVHGTCKEETKKKYLKYFTEKMLADINQTYFSAKIAGQKSLTENIFIQQRQKLSAQESITDCLYLQVHKM